MKVESIIKDRLQAIDDAQAPVECAEIAGLSDGDVVVVARPVRRMGRGPLAFGAAVLAVIAFGVVPLLMRAGDETNTGDQTVATTLPATDLEPFPPLTPAEVVVDGYEPFGPVQIEYSVAESDYLPNGSVLQHGWGVPNGGGLVETSSGYLTLAQDPVGRSALLTSNADATEWVELGDVGWIGGADADTTQNPSDPLRRPLGRGNRGRIFEAGGSYWIEIPEPTRLYRSDDGVEWDEIQLPDSSEWSYGVVGFPLVDHRFVDFGNRLVAFSDGNLISVDITSGDVTTHPYPWETPSPRWFSSVVIGGDLHVYISSALEQPEATRPPVLEEWVTSNLADWRGPLRPPMAYAETKAFGVIGTPESGYLAPIEAFREIPVANLQGMYSSDGLNWQRFVLPLGGWWIERQAAPVRIGGDQGLLTLQEGALWVSDDGHTWQLITIPRPETLLSASSRLSVSVVGESIYVFEQHETQLHTWKVSFADGTSQ